jgi:ABC-type phosphate transport system auxiliary subunit
MVQKLFGGVEKAQQLVHDLAAIDQRRLKQIGEILDKAKALTSGDPQSLNNGLEMVRLISEMPVEKMKAVSQMLADAKKLTETLPPELLQALKEK